MYLSRLAAFSDTPSPVGDGFVHGFGVEFVVAGGIFSLTFLVQDVSLVQQLTDETLHVKQTGGYRRIACAQRI
jgi:hypothetical protein